MKSIQPYIDRLYNEWTTHGKIIIGVDFDDTIFPWRAATQEDCDRVITLLKRAKHTGVYITIHTACSRERYEEIQNYCKEKGLTIDSINENPIELPYGNDKKIYANIFLDDRAGLNESLEILETTMYRISADKFKESINEQTSP
jgi:hypothetical protein